MWKRIKGRLFGFGTGLERLLTCMLDLENIIDATIFEDNKEILSIK